jgi:hypothetical protein
MQILAWLQIEVEHLFNQIIEFCQLQVKDQDLILAFLPQDYKIIYHKRK